MAISFKYIIRETDYGINYNGTKYVLSDVPDKLRAYSTILLSDARCNDEEWAFFEKYGRDSFFTWFRMSSSERDELEEVKSLYLSFWELYYYHFEDLKLYAIMYRNVSIAPIMSDIVSVSYFVSKQKEIIGYKQRLMDAKSLKEEVALLYFNNQAVFFSTFSKYISGCIVGRGNLILCPRLLAKMKSLNIEMINQYRTKEKLHNFGIDNLTDEECRILLLHKALLTEEYNNLYNKYFKNHIECNSNKYGCSEKFAHEIFIPFCHKISSVKKLQCFKGKEDEIVDYIKNYQHLPCLKENLDLQFSTLEFSIVHSWCAAIEKIHKMKREKDKELQEILNQQKEEVRKIEGEKRKKEEEARREKFRYNQINSHYRDANISFDKKKHIYSVNGKNLESVTTFVDNSFPKFNAQFHAQNKARTMGVTVQELLDLWEKNGKKSRELGTLLHEKIERYYQGINSIEDDSFKLFKIFAENEKLEPYRTEWTIYDYNLRIAGTIDFVNYQDNQFSIYDWKRSNKLIANGFPAKIDPYGVKGNYPIEHLDNSSYYRYALQLSIYKYILEHNYDMEISHLRLGIFHPSYGQPHLLEIPYLENEINTIFKLRSEIIY